jgi:hypothetical protein
MLLEKVIVILKGYRKGGAGIQIEGPFNTQRLAEEREKELWEEEWWSFFYDGCGGFPYPGVEEARERLGRLPKDSAFSAFWTSIKEVGVPALDSTDLRYRERD